MSCSVPDTELFPLSYPAYVYNFAYGSNMHPDVLTGRRKIHPIESIPGVLKSWQLTFDIRGIPAIEPSFGNIKQNSDSEVHGVLHKMSAKDFKHLLLTEGGSGVDPNGYVPKMVSINAYDGRIIEAYALVVSQTSPAILSHYVLPSHRYLNLLRKGATRHNIDPLYVEYLQSLPSIERNKFMVLVVVLELLLLIALLAPIWAPVIIYYMFNRKFAHARAFFFHLIMSNLWSIYTLFGISRTRRPYYSEPFPLNGTDCKTIAEANYSETQNHEQCSKDNMLDTFSGTVSSTHAVSDIIRRKNNPNFETSIQQGHDEE